MTPAEKRRTVYLVELDQLADDPTTAPEVFVEKIDEGIRLFLATGVSDEDLQRMYQSRAQILQLVKRKQELDREISIAKGTGLGEYMREHMSDKQPQA